MRIVAGTWRGRKLAAPDGLGTRPTAARSREALFSMLASRLGNFEGLNVLDLFAGSGALGLEALSRGASHATFVERDRHALAALRANVSALSAADRTSIISRDATYAIPLPAPAQLVLLDPPYGEDMEAQALRSLAGSADIAEGALIAVETASEAEALATDMEILAERTYGKARITLIRKPG
ncbi:MAG: 16S rRNA (guanine(966)-N(2))-methyltransferase RsmD [Pacificimonas sp.]